MKKGSKMTKEAIDKISKNRKGKALGNTNGFKKGEPSWNNGFNNNNSEQLCNFLGCVAVAQEA